MNGLRSDRAECRGSSPTSRHQRARVLGFLQSDACSGYIFVTYAKATQIMMPENNSRKKRGRFRRGESGNPAGRPRGRPNKIVSELRNGIVESAVRMGNMLAQVDQSPAVQQDPERRARVTGSKGLVRALEQLFVTNPSAWASLVAKCIPQQHELEVEAEVTHNPGWARERLKQLLDAKLVDITPQACTTMPDEGRINQAAAAER